MSTRDHIKNTIIRLLCAIVLLLVQSDVLTVDYSYLKIPTTAIELIQAEPDDAIQSLDTDDYYRQASRAGLGSELFSLLMLACLPDIFYTPQYNNNENIFVDNIDFKFGYESFHTAFCVFRI